MNNTGVDRCPVLIVEQQPCLAALLAPILVEEGFGPIIHVRACTPTVARWVGFFGAFTLLDVPLQNKQMLASADSVSHLLQECDPIEHNVAASLILLLGHPLQLTALPGVVRTHGSFLIKPFGPAELLLRLHVLVGRRQRAHAGRAATAPF